MHAQGDPYPSSMRLPDLDSAGADSPGPGACVPTPEITLQEGPHALCPPASVGAMESLSTYREHRYQSRHPRMTSRPLFARTRIRQLGRVATLLAVGALVTSSASGILADLTPEQEARKLVGLVERAQEIVTGTITDTLAYLDGRMVWTKYTVAVDSVIKGSPCDTPLTFVAEGGMLGTRSTYVEHSNGFQIGERWLLFLARCRTDEDRRTLGFGVGRIAGDSILANPQGDYLYTPTFLDSVRSLSNHCSIDYQKANADLVILSAVDSIETAPNERYSRTTTSVYGTILEVLSQKRGPPLQSQERFAGVAVPSTGTRSSRSEKPVLRAGRTYVLFMRRSGPTWELNSSIYSAWCRADSIGFVEELGHPCAGGAAYVVAIMPWLDLLDRLRDP